MRQITMSLVLMAAFSCLAFGAQALAQPSGCMERAKTQSELTACANEAAMRADTELNDIYRRLQSAVAKNPDAAAKIRVAERAWLATGMHTSMRCIRPPTSSRSMDRAFRWSSIYFASS
jgi:uncharacterized protein YecT (DUF1311 family)